MTTSTNSPSLLILRITACLLAALSIVQAVLGFVLLGGGAPQLHKIIGMASFAISVIASIAAVLWARPSGNKGLMFHAIGVMILAVAQVGIGEAGLAAGGLQTVHASLGVLYLVAAVALATLSIRKPLGSNPAS